MKTKFFTFFLAIMASTGIVYASDTQVDGIWYDFDYSTLTATVTYRGYSYDSYDNEYTGSVSIPSSVTYNDVTYSVTSIGDWAFRGCSGLTSITIPNSVTSIGYWAFYGCYGLTSVEIPNSVTSIEGFAFSSCYGLTNIVVESGNTVYDSRENCNAIIETSSNTLIQGCQNTIIPNSVASIGDWAFSSCYGLTSITIPNSVTSIGTQAFYNCSGLTSITIGNSVTSIGRGAFEGCTGLTSVTIGNSVTSIGDLAFYGCSGLTSVTCLRETPASLGYDPFNECSNLNAIYVPCGTLDTYKSYWTQYQSYIQFTPTEYAIIGNVNREDAGTVSVPQTICDNVITAIPNYGYHFVQWSDGVKDNPRTIELTQDTTFTAEFAKNEYTITTESANPEWGTTSGDTTALYLDEVPIYATANYGYHFAQWSDEVTDNPRTVTITADETYQAVFAKNTYSITTNAINGSVSGESQAEYLDDVELAAIPNYGYHFVQWSDGETENPRSFVLTQDTTFTAEFAVNTSGQCGDNLAWAFTDGVLSITGDGDMWDGQPWRAVREQISEINFPQGITSIGSRAFENCVALTELNIPNTVNYVGNYAFLGCSGLTILEIPKSVTGIGPDAFSGCRGVVQVEAPALFFDIQFDGRWNNDGMKIKSVVVNAGYLYESTLSQFRYVCKTLTNLDIEDIINTTLPDKTFEDFYKLETLVLPSNLTKISYMMVAGCKNLKYIEIPASVEEIEQSAFEDCRSLASVEFEGNALTRISNWAFYNVHALRQIVIPEGVTEIGDGAFYGCTYLNNLSLPASVQSIGDNAFALCSKLQRMDVDAVEPPAVEEKTFFEVSTEAPVYVPEASVEIYKEHPVWGKLNIIGNTPQGIANANANANAVKVLRNGQIFILRGDKTYTIQGQQIK